MDLQLKKHTLFSILKEKGELGSGICVQTEGLSVKMAVMGYIPIPVDNTFDFLVSSFWIGNIKRVIVGSDRILFSDILSPKKTYPITKRIAIAKVEERYELTNTLTLLQLQYKTSEYIKQYKTNKSKVPSSRILKLSEQLEEIDGNIYYKPQSNEFVMYRFKDADTPLVIASGFLCLCSYINTITGKIEYDVYDPDELIEILP